MPNDCGPAQVPVLILAVPALPAAPNAQAIVRNVLLEPAPLRRL